MTAAPDATPPQAVPTGVATGIGSVPGSAPGEAARWVTDALPELPHLPELPARGPWASITGRGASLLVDLPLELELDRWRTAQAPGRDLRRARALLAEDLDALEEVLDGYTGPVKVQVCGPLTLAATAELRGGDVLLSDPAAVRDVAASLAEGVAAHLHDLARRLGGADLVLQVDEPALPAATAGTIPRPSGWGVHPAVPADLATAGLTRVLRAAEDVGATTVVHCCADDPDWSVLAGCGAGGLSLDLTVVDLASSAETLGAWVDSGRVVWAGVDLTNAADAHDRVRSLGSVLGLGAAALLDVVAVTPRCGLADVTDGVARSAYASAQDVVRRLQDAT